MALFSKAFAAGALFVAAANLNLVKRAVHTAFVVLAVLNFARYALVYVIHHIKNTSDGGFAACSVYIVNNIPSVYTS